jgi:hypothetical protein
MRSLILVLALTGAVAGQTAPQGGASVGSPQESLDQTEIVVAPSANEAPTDSENPRIEAVVEPPSAADSTEPSAEQSLSVSPPENDVSAGITSESSAQTISTAAEAQRESASSGPIVGVLVLLLLGLISTIPAFIAKSKGRRFLRWWIYGLALFPFALIHSAFLRFVKPKSSLQMPRPTPVQRTEVALPVADPQPQHEAGEGGIRQRLRQFSHHVKCECVGCGYSGYMGLVKRTKPLHENGLFKLLAFMGGPARLWYAAFAFMGGVAKNILQCPNCGATLEQVAGSRPSLMLFGGR